MGPGLPTHREDRAMPGVRSQTPQRNFSSLLIRIGFYKRDLGERLVQTKKIFGHRVYAVDLHTHSTFSDGADTVNTNYASMENAGLDFMFATDHSSRKQKRSSDKLKYASWGQEPGIGPQHIGLLHGSRLFRPHYDSPVADFTRARNIAEFVWIPHPAGWYPGTWYNNEQIEVLWTFGNEFAIEVINGANKIVRAYDAFDAKAITVWDKLLSDGRKITAVGASDAHVPEAIGSVWTGVFSSSRTASSIIKALNANLCFASEASLLNFSCGSSPMGATVSRRKGASVSLRFRVADSAGLDSVRIISQGRVVKEIEGNNKTLVSGVWTAKSKTKPVYYRLESTSADDRRAFSTPIYITPV